MRPLARSCGTHRAFTLGNDPSTTFGWSQKIEMADAQRVGDFVNRDDRRVPIPLFEAADVLLAEAANLHQLLLGQALPQPNAANIPPHQLAHVHAPKSAGYKL